MMKICSFLPLLSMLSPTDENLSLDAKHIWVFVGISVVHWVNSVVKEPVRR